MIGRLFLVAFAATACMTATPSQPPSPSVGAVRYVALGDSYTIGTDVDQSERWPDQLVGKLAGSVDLELVANLGVNGYSSFNVLDRELPLLDALDPDFVTLLIGVNDVVRGTPADKYRENLDQIFDFLLDRLPASRIVVVSTPDYTLTPAGNSFGDPLQQRAAISEFNGIEQEIAQSRGIKFVDISGMANEVPQDPSLVADDGLHPSGRQYAGWVELIAPVVANLFAQ
ncbi:MAG: SGNH/GDSL hydrolase family protein [Chloroflexota bacterium]